jgi:peptidoglycan/LPS O-acetylase OafA/YrhL
LEEEKTLKQASRSLWMTRFAALMAAAIALVVVASIAYDPDGTSEMIFFRSFIVAAIAAAVAVRIVRRIQCGRQRRR